MSHVGRTESDGDWLPSFTSQKTFALHLVVVYRLFEVVRAHTGVVLVCWPKIGATDGTVKILSACAACDAKVFFCDVSVLTA
jgi:hypothetical protein